MDGRLTEYAADLLLTIWTILGTEPSAREAMRISRASCCWRVGQLEPLRRPELRKWRPFNEIPAGTFNRGSLNRS
jgi:hypothetical protein